MSKETVEIGGIKYELHDRKAEVGDNVIITYKHEISEYMFEVGDIFKVTCVRLNGDVEAEKDGYTKILFEDEYKVLHPVSSENEPDDTTESDTPIMDVLAKISRSISALDKRIHTLEVDIKDLRENLTEELYESYLNINELSIEIDDLHDLVRNVRDYTLDLTETIEMHTDDIVMLDERTQDLLIRNKYK